jgi:hypothetical protein
MSQLKLLVYATQRMGLGSVRKVKACLWLGHAEYYCSDIAIAQKPWAAASRFGAEVNYCQPSDCSSKQPIFVWLLLNFPAHGS